MRRTIFACTAMLLINSVGAETLTNILKNAEMVDPTLASSRVTREASQENVSIARSKLLPQMGFQSTNQKTNQRREDQSPTLGAVTNRYKVNATNSQLYFSQALFHKRDWDGLSVANIQAEYADYQLAGAFSDLWQRVINAWLDVVAAKEVRLIYQLGIESAKHAAEQSKKALLAGSGTKDAAIEAESQYEWAKANLVEANLNFESRLRAFNNLTGNKGGDFQQRQLPSYSKIRFPLANYQDFYQKSLDVSPNLVVAKLTEQIRKAQVSQSEADHYPTLDLVGSYAKTNNDNVNLIGSKVTSSAIGLQLTIPIYSGGGVSATARQARSIYLAAIADRQALELKMNTQIDADWSIQQSYLDKVSGAMLMVTAAKEALRSNQMGLKAGFKTWGDVAGAQTVLVKRQVDYVGYLSTGLKAQLRLLALLPISDESWSVWLGQLDNQTNGK